MSNPAVSILSVLVQIKEALDEGNKINRKIAEELAKGNRPGYVVSMQESLDPRNYGGRG